MEQKINMHNPLIIATACLGWVAGAIMASPERPDMISVARADTLIIDEPEMNENSPEFLEHERQIRCLARNIYFEARSEGLAGRIAVGHVTLNRVSSGRHPADICSVVKQAKRDEHGMPMLNRCAFSWYCDGIPDTIRQQEVFDEIEEIARAMIEGDRYADDITEGSTYYHNRTVHPRWADQMEKTAVIDGHIFYREKY